MKQIVFNSFPRSGNVYQGSISRHFFNTMQATVHMPEIFKVEELNNVTIFRKPEDAIASLITKNGLGNVTMPSEGEVQSLISLYKKYMYYAEINKELIYIGKFNNLIVDPIKHFENLSKYFNMPLQENYKESFKNAEFTGKLWDDRYDGHIPRPKDSVRIELEKNISFFTSIQELNKEYEDFIKKHATVI
jgi:hypothetical protein